MQDKLSSRGDINGLSNEAEYLSHVRKCRWEKCLYSDLRKADKLCLNDYVETVSKLTVSHKQNIEQLCTQRPSSETNTIENKAKLFLHEHCEGKVQAWRQNAQASVNLQLMQIADVGRGQQKNKYFISNINLHKSVNQCKENCCKLQSEIHYSLSGRSYVNNSFWYDACYVCILKIIKSSPKYRTSRLPVSPAPVPCIWPKLRSICGTTVADLHTYDFPSMHKSTRPKDGYSKKMECFKGSDKTDSSVTRKHAGLSSSVEVNPSPETSNPLNGKAIPNPNTLASLMHETEELLKVNETEKLCMSSKRQVKDLCIKSSHTPDHLQIAKPIEDLSDHRTVQICKGISGFDVNGNLAYDTAKSEGSIESAFITPPSQSATINIICDGTKSGGIHVKLNKQIISSEKPVNSRNVLFENACSKSELICNTTGNKSAFPSNSNTKNFTGSVNEVVSSRRLAISPEFGKSSDPLLKLVHLHSSRVDSSINQSKGSALCTHFDTSKKLSNQGNYLDIDTQHNKNLNLDVTSGSENLKRLFSSTKQCFLPKDVSIKNTVIESKVSNFCNNFSPSADKGCIYQPKINAEFIKPQFKQIKKTDLKEASRESFSELTQPIAGNFSDKMIFPALPTHCFQRETTGSSLNKSAINKSCESIDLEDLQSFSTGERIDGQLHHFCTTAAAPSNPQASYADVIRMPPPLGKISTHQGATFSENKNEDSVQLIENMHHGKFQKKDDVQHTGSSEWIISRLSQLDINSSSSTSVNIMLPHSNQNGKDPVNPRAIVVSLEKPSFYNSGLMSKNYLHSSCNSVNIHSTYKLGNDDRGLIDYKIESMSPCKENEKKTSLASQCAHDLDNLPNQRLGVTINATVEPLSSNPSSISSSICETYKFAGSSSSSGDSLVDPKMKQPPVIFMDNCATSGGMSEISFGIDSEELTRLCLDGSIVSNVSAVDDTFAEVSTNDSAFKQKTNESKLPTTEVCAEVSVQDESCCDQKLLENADSDCSNITSHLDINGKSFFWKRAEVNTQSCNIEEIVSYLRESWNMIEKGYKNDDGRSVRYYSDA